MGLFDPSLSAGRRNPEPKRGFLRRMPWDLRLLVLGCIYIPAIAGLLLAGAFVYYTATIPNPMALRQKQSAPVVRILARDGSLLTERGGAAPYVPIDLVAAASHRCRARHRGPALLLASRASIRPASAVRCSTNLKAGRFVQGGSTITQQLAKNIFLTSERTLVRKFEELVLALWLELRLDKPDILELYLNRVYFGGGAYGVESASRRFFNKSAADVTMAEAAVLAGLLKAPSKYSPAWNPGLARERAEGVLATMVEAGFASPIDGALNSIADVQFAEPQVMRGETGVEYAVDAVLDRLPSLMAGNDREIIVETTIDGVPAAACAADGARPHRDRRQGHGCKPGRHGAARHGGRHHGAGGRTLLRREPVQSRAAGKAPARIGLQALRLSRGARERTDAREHGAGRADPRQRLEPQQRRRALSRPGYAARGPHQIDQHGCRAPAHEQRRAQDGGSRQAARHPLGTAPRCVAGAWHLGSDADGTRRRLWRIRQRRQAHRAAYRQARAHRLGPRALPAAQRDRQDRRGRAARRRDQRHAELGA